MLKICFHTLNAKIIHIKVLQLDVSLCELLCDFPAKLNTYCWIIALVGCILFAINLKSTLAEIYLQINGQLNLEITTQLEDNWKILSRLCVQDWGLKNSSRTRAALLQKVIMKHSKINQSPQSSRHTCNNITYISCFFFKNNIWEYKMK